MKSGPNRYVPCRSCGFYIRGGVKSCPNCGIARPSSRHRDEKKALLAVLLSFSSSVLTLVLILIAFLYVEDSRPLTPLFALPVLLSGTGIATILAMLRGRGKSADCLFRNGETILARIGELAGLRDRVGAIRRHVLDLDDSPRKRSLLAMLEDVSVRIERYGRNYRVQLCRYEVIRWFNAVLPVTSRFQEAGFEESEKLLTRLALQIREGEELLATFLENRAITANGAGQQVCDELSEKIAFARSLSEEIVARQTRNLIRSISPASLSAAGARTESVIDTAALSIDIERALVSLSDSFNDLDHEYERFRAEFDLEKLS